MTRLRSGAMLSAAVIAGVACGGTYEQAFGPFAVEATSLRTGGEDEEVRLDNIVVNTGVSLTETDWTTVDTESYGAWGTRRYTRRAFGVGFDASSQGGMNHGA